MTLIYLNCRGRSPAGRPPAGAPLAGSYVSWSLRASYLWRLAVAIFLFCFFGLFPGVGVGVVQSVQAQEPGPDAALAVPQASTGSGFFVGKSGLIVTSFHVVSGKKEVFVRRFASDLDVPVRVVASDSQNDLALLLFTDPVAGLPLADWKTVPIGLDLFAMGYSNIANGLNGLRITRGLLNGLVEVDAGPKMFQFSAEIHRGNSGGPVLSPEGLVIGVIRGKADALKLAKKIGEITQNLNFAVSSDTVANLLKKAGMEIEVKAVRPDGGLAGHTVFAQSKAAVVRISAR